MSRFSLRPLAHHTDLFEIALGWDPGLGTYFVTVFGTPDRDREPHNPDRPASKLLEELLGRSRSAPG